MTEPTTAAGRALLKHLLGQPEEGLRHILAIEDEAFAKSHRWCVPHGHVDPEPHMVTVTAAGRAAEIEAVERVLDTLKDVVKRVSFGRASVTREELGDAITETRRRALLKVEN